MASLCDFKGTGCGGGEYVRIKGTGVWRWRVCVTLRVVSEVLLKRAKAFGWELPRLYRINNRIYLITALSSLRENRPRPEMVSEIFLKKQQMDTVTRILIITNDEMVTLYYKLYFGIICTANKSDSDSQVQTFNCCCLYC